MKTIDRKEILFLMGASIFLINAGSISSSSGGSSSSDNSSKNPSITSSVSQNSMELENGLRMVEGLVYSKKLKRALNQLRVLENKYSDSADVHNYLGFVYRKMNELTKSGNHYDKALRIEPMHIGALEYQGELFVMKKQIKEAQKNLNLLKQICGVNCKEYKKLKKVINK